MKRGYPVVLNLQGRRAVVVGCGPVGARKVHHLVESGASVTVISPTLNSLVDTKSIIWLQRTYAFGDLAGADLVFACTDDNAVNARVCRDAVRSQWVNNTSDPAQSDFFNAAIIESEDAVIAISTRSHIPGKAHRIKRRLLTFLETGWKLTSAHDESHRINPERLSC